MVVSPTRSASAARRTPRRRRIGILDLVTKSPRNSLYGRLMNANLASIMPQVLGVWCEQAGHQVTYVCFTGGEDLLTELPPDLDVLFIGAFTQAAQLAYALSNLYRSRGAVTVLGGPHARCYPEDARQYFDYVLGFTDQARRGGRARRMRAAPARGPRHGRQPPALGAAHPPGALEVRRGRAGQGADDQVRPHDRQPRLPVYLQLLHRLDRRLPAARLRAGERGPRLSAHQDGASDRRLARPQLRRAVRRLHGSDRVRGAAGPDAAHRREQPVAARRAAPQAPPGRTASRPSSRASSRGTTWATSRRPAAPGWRRCNRSRST